MRINIVIDDVVMADALKATGLKTKREAVELGRRTWWPSRSDPFV